MNISWNADAYKQNFAFVHQYGVSVTELIDFQKATTAIDLGCGNGVLTAAMKEKGLDVTGLDASPEQLEIARKNYPDIPFVLADATNFTVKEPVDVVFSNAVFHWIDRNGKRICLPVLPGSCVPEVSLCLRWEVTAVWPKSTPR